MKTAIPTIVAAGELLWDVLPAGPCLGGAPPNLLFHFLRLGGRGFLVSSLGQDAAGRALRQKLREFDFDDRFVMDHASLATGVANVELDAEGKAKFEIPGPVAWDDIDYSLFLSDPLRDQVDAVVVGCLGQRTEAAHQATMTLIDSLPSDCAVVLDVNLRPPHFSLKALEHSLERTDILKLNDDELAYLANLYRLPRGLETAVRALAERFAIRFVLLTLGEKGSLIYHRDTNHFSRHAGHATEVKDTVGAGDSFTATFLYGLIQGHELGSIHDRASRIASYVCSQHGATPELPAALLA